MSKGCEKRSPKSLSRQVRAIQRLLQCKRRWGVEQRCEME
jgi:hypothetical protein